MISKLQQAVVIISELPLGKPDNFGDYWFAMAAICYIATLLAAFVAGGVWSNIVQ